MQNNILNISGLEIKIDSNLILKPFDLALGDGDFAVIMGLSGVGKSQIIRAITGLSTFKTGQIEIREAPGVVFQKPNLIPWLSAERNVQICSQIELNEIHRWFEKFNLTPVKDYLPLQLSGGMQQKVSIARALCFNSRFIILDEPFTNLDQPQRIQFLKLLKNLWKDQKLTVIYVTHDIREALFLGQKIFYFSRKNKSLDLVIENKLQRSQSYEQIESSPEYKESYEQLSQRLYGDYEE